MVTSMFGSLVQFDAKGFGSAADLGLRLCHYSWVGSPSTAWFWKILSALVLIVVFWSMSPGASPSARGWHAWLIMISVGAVSVFMICGGGLRVPLPCCSIVQCWGCGSTCSSCLSSCPTYFQSHVPAAILALRRGAVFPEAWWCRTFPRVETFCTLEWEVLRFTWTLWMLASLAISPVFFVWGPGLKKSVKVCASVLMSLLSVFSSHVGIVAASAAAYAYNFMFSVATACVCVFSQVAQQY